MKKTLIAIGYEPADITVHPSLRTAEGSSYRCLVFPKKCSQRKSFSELFRLKYPKKRGF